VSDDAADEYVDVHDREPCLHVRQHDMHVPRWGRHGHGPVELRHAPSHVSDDTAHGRNELHGGNGRRGRVSVRHDDVSLPAWRRWRRLDLQLTPA
jgi:hypothetical protein